MNVAQSWSNDRVMFACLFKTENVNKMYFKSNRSVLFIWPKFRYTPPVGFCTVTVVGIGISMKTLNNYIYVVCPTLFICVMLVVEYK